MDLARIASLIAAAVVAAVALQAALRLTEPRGHTPTRQELASAEKALDESYRTMLERATRRLERARKNVKPRDFPTHYKWAVEHSMLLRYRSLSATQGRVGLAEPDAELLRIVELCREYARDERDDAELDRFEVGRVWASAAHGD